MEYLIFFVTFGILFLGELCDKTQLVVFNLALEHKKPYKVGIGATLGFAVIVTIGIFFGLIITRFIPLTIITIASGIMFLLIGLIEIYNLRSLYQERKMLEEDNHKDKSCIADNTKNITKSSHLSNLKKNPYIAGFSFILLMELGDKTQILTITLASIYNNPLEVWLGAFLALTILAWIGVFFGRICVQKIPKFHLKLISAIIFTFIGVLIILTSILF